MSDSHTSHADAAAMPGPQPAAAPRVRLVDNEPPWDALLQEWLQEAGFEVEREGTRRPDLLLVGLSFPRRAGPRPLEPLRQAWPGVPVLALSPTLHAGVATDGELARRLEVQALVALPTRREQLLAAVRRALEAAR